MAAQFLIVSEDGLGERALDAAHHGGIAATTVDSTDVAFEQLRMGVAPVALDLRTTGGEAFVSALRADHALARTPVIALIPEAHDAAFATALAWGVDEVLPAESFDQLPSMARALARPDLDARPTVSRGTVILAAATSEERRMRARPLYAAGYDVLFAADPDELAGALDRENVAFVLADTALFTPDPVRRIRSLFHADPRRHPWVLIARAPAIPELLGAFRDLPVGIVGRNAGPDDALFIGNDLLGARASDGRASQRLLHATVASFRLEGTNARRYGFTYNISREGLYVRTVVAPPRGTRAWIELRPLAGEHLVHLEVEIAWTRPYGTVGGATAPAGFGARITDGSTRNLERWRAGYGRLTQAFATVRPAPVLSMQPAAIP